MDLSLICDPSYWRELAPDLSVSEEARSVDQEENQVSIGAVEMERLVEEGYFKMPRSLSEDFMAGLLRGVCSVKESGYIPLFSFMYDEYWECFFNFRNVLSNVFDDQTAVLPDFWLWYVDPKNGESGWKPHRDKNSNTLLVDGRPSVVTIWIPLSDATTLNGCMYIIPANKDANYTNFQDHTPATDLQSIRALPAVPGDAFLWNHRVYHWGSHSSKHADGPRVSMAMEFQRLDGPAYRDFLLAMNVIPSFEQRVALIGKQILQYRHMYSYSDELVNIAEQMVGYHSLTGEG